MPAIREDAAGIDLLTPVMEFFTSRSIPIAPVDDSSFLLTVYAGESGQWWCYAAVDEETRTFVFTSVVEVEVSDDRLAAVTEFLMRASAGLVIGGFEMDMDTREIFFKTSIDVEGDRLTTALVANVVIPNVVLTDRFRPGLFRVAAGLAEPRAALAAIDADERDAD